MLKAPEVLLIVLCNTLLEAGLCPIWRQGQGPPNWTAIMWMNGQYPGHLYQQLGKIWKVIHEFLSKELADVFKFFPFVVLQSISNPRKWQRQQQEQYNNNNNLKLGIRYVYNNL